MFLRVIAWESFTIFSAHRKDHNQRKPFIVWGIYLGKYSSWKVLIATRRFMKVGLLFGADYCLTASTWINNLTLSGMPKSIPQFMPHWLRMMVVSKSPPQTSRLSMGWS